MCHKLVDRALMSDTQFCSLRQEILPTDVAELQLKLKEANVQLTVTQNRYDALREQVDDQTHLHLHYEEGIRGHDAVRSLFSNDHAFDAHPPFSPVQTRTADQRTQEYA